MRFFFDRAGAGNSVSPNLFALAVLAGAILAAGCVNDNPPATAVAAPADASIATPVTVMMTNTVVPVPATPVCAYPPLNPWTWVPESYTPAATTILPPAMGTAVSKADLFGTPSLNWKEYQTHLVLDSAQSEGTWRIEFLDHDYAGNPAILENFTYTNHGTGTGIENPVNDTVIDDYYYDEYGNMISAHRRYTREGTFLENGEIPPVKLNKGSPDCSGDIFAPRYTYIGSEPVAVPAGSYPDAMKYSGNVDASPSGNVTGIATYWFASGVPVPVMMKIEEPGVVHTVKLTGWG
jgi:hypothetical protein